MPTPDQAPPGRDVEIPVAERHFVLAAPLRAPFPADTAQAIFGLGCFWGAEQKFWQARGVYTTAVGYAGGYTLDLYCDECGVMGQMEAFAGRNKEHCMRQAREAGWRFKKGTSQVVATTGRCICPKHNKE